MTEVQCNLVLKTSTDSEVEATFLVLGAILQMVEESNFELPDLKLKLPSEEDSLYLSHKKTETGERDYGP